ncbi:MAG: hypothetical protein L0Y79_03705 [Chlorobi bacterium]|nr:hypothetical protein [Chlorobiota bacterium]MCI0715451.1 hypothetical protein [Chlorobiota bacterium]
MTTEELKSEIQNDIDKIQDAELLEVLKIFIETHILNPSEPKLSDWQLKRIEESRKQIKEGKFYTDEEANRLTDEWLDGK